MWLPEWSVSDPWLSCKVLETGGGGCISCMKSDSLLMREAIFFYQSGKCIVAVTFDGLLFGWEKFCVRIDPQVQAAAVGMMETLLTSVPEKWHGVLNMAAEGLKKHSMSGRLRTGHFFPQLLCLPKLIVRRGESKTHLESGTSIHIIMIPGIHDLVCRLVYTWYTRTYCVDIQWSLS